MGIINTTIPNLIGGISQQPDRLKFDGQCKDSLNCYGNVKDGLKKRPYANFVARLVESNGYDSNSFIFFIDRTTIERYVALYSNDNGLKVFNLFTGNEATLTGDASYLDTGLLGEDTALKSLTVADYTFIVNRSKTVNLGVTTSPTLDNQALIFIKQGDFKKKYTVTLDGTEFTHTSGDNTNAANADTSVIAEALAGDINANIAYDATYNGNVILVSRTDLADFTISSSDGLGGRGLQEIYNQVDDITDLPTSAYNGFRVKVSGDASTEDDDYWVEFVTNDDSLVSGDYGEGSWVESVAPAVTLDIDPSTMPLTLVNTAFDTFELQEFTWLDREVGDDNTNPPPSFVGKNINDIFFFKNRLGFISDENVVFSEVSEFGNFWRTTVSQLLDSAPIDVAVSHTKVAILRHAVVTTSRLILFSDRTQFALKGDDILTNQTVSITPITNYETDLGIKPVTIGSYTYFGFQRGASTGIREYYLDNLVNDFDQNELTIHIPTLIPQNLKAITGTTSEYQIVCLPRGGSEFFLYSYYWSGKEKVLNSWSRHEVKGEILSCEFIDSDLYLVVSENGYVYLQYIPFEQGLSDGSVTESGTTTGETTMVVTGLVNSPQLDGVYSTDGSDYNGSAQYTLQSTEYNAVVRRSDDTLLYWQIYDVDNDSIIAGSLTESSDPYNITLWMEN